ARSAGEKAAGASGTHRREELALALGTERAYRGPAGAAEALQRDLRGPRHLAPANYRRRLPPSTERGRAPAAAVEPRATSMLAIRKRRRRALVPHASAQPPSLRHPRVAPPAPRRGRRLGADPSQLLLERRLRPPLRHCHPDALELLERALHRPALPRSQSRLRRPVPRLRPRSTALLLEHAAHPPRERAPARARDPGLHRRPRADGRRCGALGNVSGARGRARVVLRLRAGAPHDARARGAG